MGFNSLLEKKNKQSDILFSTERQLRDTAKLWTSHSWGWHKMPFPSAVHSCPAMKQLAKPDSSDQLDSNNIGAGLSCIGRHWSSSQPAKLYLAPINLTKSSSSLIQFLSCLHCPPLNHVQIDQEQSSSSKPHGDILLVDADASCC